MQALWKIIEIVYFIFCYFIDERKRKFLHRKKGLPCKINRIKIKIMERSEQSIWQKSHVKFKRLFDFDEIFSRILLFDFDFIQSIKLINKFVICACFLFWNSKSNRLAWITEMVSVFLEVNDNQFNFLLFSNSQKCVPKKNMVEKRHHENFENEPKRYGFQCQCNNKRVFAIQVVLK